jgi:hypothetical protein
MKTSCIAAALLLAGCASTGDKGPAAIQATGLPPCQVLAEVESLDWRLVAADGFTFCVPDGWAARHRTWRGDGATLTWETARHPRLRERRYAVTTVRGEDLQDMRHGRLPDHLFPRPRVFVDDVAGIRVEFSTHHFEGRHHISARWPRPSTVVLQGEAPHAGGILLLEEIFRTVRLID